MSLAVLLFAALPVAQGWAGAGRATAAPTVSVWAIRATHGGHEISKQLRPLAKALKKSFNFTGYRLVNKSAKPLGGGKATAFDLVKGYRATITPAGSEGGRIKLKIVVLQHKNKAYVKKLATTVALRPGKYQLLGGWQLPGGDVLIIAVSAR
ncbi:MAG: hypothetical protein ACE5E5_09240 [Phycisphaerae bacterium]